MGCVGSRCNGGEKGGHGLSTCLCIHAEENALLEAGRERIREGSILYCDTYAAGPFSLHIFWSEANSCTYLSAVPA